MDLAEERPPLLQPVLLQLAVAVPEPPVLQQLVPVGAAAAEGVVGRVRRRERVGVGASSGGGQLGQVVDGRAAGGEPVAAVVVQEGAARHRVVEVAVAHAGPHGVQAAAAPGAECGRRLLLEALVYGVAHVDSYTCDALFCGALEKRDNRIQRLIRLINPDLPLRRRNTLDKHRSIRARGRPD